MNEPVNPVRQAWRRGQPAGEDRGAGTVLMLAIIVVAMSVLGLGTAAGRLVIAEHRVRSAADLAALTGASKLATDGDGCAAAARAAAANGARLEQCSTEPGGVITVRLRAPSGISGWVARSAARAGPSRSGEELAAQAPKEWRLPTGNGSTTDHKLPTVPSSPEMGFP